jgi:hypothetical protein
MYFDGVGSGQDQVVTGSHSEKIGTLIVYMVSQGVANLVTPVALVGKLYEKRIFPFGTGAGGLSVVLRQGKSGRS